MKNKYEFETEAYLKVSQHKMRTRKRAAAFTAFSLVAVLTFSGAAVSLSNRMRNNNEMAGETLQLSAEKTDTANATEESASRTGCTAEMTPDDTSEAEESSYYHTVLTHFDYPSYSSAAEVAKAAENVYTGTVTDISFEIIYMPTGETIDTSDSSEASRMLYTVYTVQLSDSFKGENPDEIKIYRIGGLIGYKESVQYNMIEKAGLFDEYHGIPVTTDADASKLTVGAQYLFCTVRPVEGHDVPINPTQFAYDPASASANEIIAQIRQ